MEYIENLDENEFEEFARNHDLNSIFQSVAWARTKSNWEHLYTGIKDNGKLICAALVLVRDLKFNYKFAYIPRGPLIDYDNEEVLSFYFDNLKKQLKKNKVLLCKFDPNVVIDEIDFEEKDKILNYKDDEFVKRLEKFDIGFNGYTLKIKDSIQPRIQMEKELMDLENTLPGKTGKIIRASYKKGVKIINEHNNPESVANMVVYTTKRHQIKLRNYDYFKRILDSFGENSTVFSAYLDDKLISSTLIVYSKNTCEALYAGYVDEYKNYNSTYPLRFEAMKWARSKGCKYYNFGGVEGSLDDGLTLFKSKFMPRIKIYIGEFNMFPYGLLSKIALKAYKVMK